MVRISATNPPGVYTREIDKSERLDSDSVTGCAFVGTSVRGNTKRPILITNTEEALTLLGKPRRGRDIQLHSALLTLEGSSRVFFRRVTPDDASLSAIAIQPRGNNVAYLYANMTDFGEDSSAKTPISVQERIQIGTGDGTNKVFTYTIKGKITSMESLIFGDITQSLNSFTDTALSSDTNKKTQTLTAADIAGTIEIDTSRKIIIYKPTSAPSDGVEIYINVEYESDEAVFYILSKNVGSWGNEILISIYDVSIEDHTFVVAIRNGDKAPTEHLCSLSQIRSDDGVSLFVTDVLSKSLDVDVRIGTITDKSMPCSFSQLVLTPSAISVVENKPEASVTYLATEEVYDVSVLTIGGEVYNVTDFTTSSVSHSGELATKFDLILDRDIQSTSTSGASTLVYNDSSNNIYQPLQGGTDGDSISENKILSLWDEFDDRDTYEDVRILVSAGHTGVNIPKKLVDIAIRRKDIIAILDVPIDYTNPLGGRTPIEWVRRVLKVRTSYAAVYAPWIKVVDKYNGSSSLVLPPSGYAAKSISLTHVLDNVWVAPAGVNRGGVESSQYGFVALTNIYSDERYGIMYNKYGINLIRTTTSGTFIWGQKTLHGKHSSFDRLNVRFLIIDLEVKARTILHRYLFELNTDDTRARIVADLSQRLDYVKRNDGLYDYRLVCDKTNNTGEVIDNNELNVDLWVRPVKSAEFIILTTIVNRETQSITSSVSLRS